MKVAIAGCGIAGTTVACLLAEQGHEVTLFEQAEHCGPVGAGIMIQPQGQAILARLGIYDALSQQSAQLNSIEAVRDSGKRLIKLEYPRLRSELYALGVHRGRLFSMLFALAQKPGVTIRENARITDYKVTPAGVTLNLASGESTDLFDFIIATDGSRSSLRQTSGIPFHCIEYDYGALWTTGVCAAVTNQLLQIVSGTRKLAGLLPIGKGECSFFWGLTAAQYENYQQQGFDRWKQEVLDLCPLSEELLSAVQGFDEFTFTTYRSVSMRRWHADRIVFLGDAAHPTSPHLGQGANLALEDAAIFAECLKQEPDFNAACQTYERLRSDKLRFYQQITRWLSPFFQSDGVIRGWGRDLFLPIMSQTPVLREQMLKTLCGFKTGWLHSQLPDQN